jgi:hypothetical protein
MTYSQCVFHLSLRADWLLAFLPHKKKKKKKKMCGSFHILFFSSVIHSGG